MSLVTSSSYAEAKKALNAAAPDRVISRGRESDEIRSHLLACFKEKNGVSIYVNGQPGTGKTLCVDHILLGLKSEGYKFKQFNANCMSIKNIQTLYKILTAQMESSAVGASLDNSMSLTPSKRSANKENLAKSVESQIQSLKNHFVLVLDEIDQIETTIKSNTDLYKIFEWPYLPNSKLILIGIANSLDFTDRLLPRLELKPECKPRIIKFLPYSKDDIIKIVKDRLRSEQNSETSAAVIDDKALMLCASKIASTTGDIRKVLDICRRAIEVVEQEVKFNTSSGNGNVKAVSIGHMMRIFNEINPMTNSNLDKNTMPLMQKILLCTILLCNKDMKVKEIQFSKLFDKFNKISKAYSTTVDSESEFVNLCTLLQDNGLVDVKKTKDVRSGKVSLRIDEQELNERLQDENFMADILTNPLYK